MEYKLKLKNENRWLCTEKYKPDEEGIYEPILTCHSMKDLIEYALTYKFDFEIPKGYKYKKIYIITCSTANFEPNNRKYSTVSSCNIFMSENKKEAENKFKEMIKKIKNKNTRTLGKYCFCWHTEDYAINQVIHSYNLTEGYVIENI